MSEQNQESGAAFCRDLAGRAAGHPDACAVAVLLAAAVLLFAPTLGFGLLHGWDDNLYITNNTARLTLSPANLGYWFTHDCVSCYLPLTMISYMVDYALWGLNAFGYRLQNLFWHAVAVVAFYGLLRSLRLNVLPAFLAVLLWAVHPQRVESVVWVSERKDVLCAALYLLALLAYVRALARSRWPWLALGLFAGALLSKSMAVSLPVVLVAVEWQQWVSRNGVGWPERAAWRAIAGRVLPFVLLALACVPLTILFQVIPTGETTRAHQVGAALHNLFWYGLRTFVPGKTCPLYPRLEFTGWRVLWLVIGLLACLAALGRAWRRHPTFTVGVVVPALIAYAAALAPVSGLVPLGYVDMSDRYSYIPSVFLWALAAAVLQGMLRRFAAGDGRRARTLCLAAAATLAVAYTTATALSARCWRDIETLMRAACDREPANVFALGQLGNILLDAQRFDEALVIGGRLAASSDTWMTPATRQQTLWRGLYVQGFALFRLGQVEAAMRAFEAIAPCLETAVFHEPTNNAAIYAMMAEGYLEAGAKDKALACYRAILGRVPAGSFEWHFYSGVLSLHSGDPVGARQHFRAADRLKPGQPLVQRNLQELGPDDATPPR
jgi:protein O-mannosyl-transferase